jgi:putative ABC transport system permease protein
VGIPVPRKPSGLQGYIVLRSFGPKALALRPEFKLVSGRMYEPGKQELMVGIAAPGQFAGVDVGDRVVLPDGEWPIVGSFRTGGDVVEAELVGDTDTLMAALRKSAYNSVIVRLARPDALATLKGALTTDPSLSVRVERHSDYYARRSAQFSNFYDALAYGISAILASGALFGAVNILYSAVAVRSREIGTLRALGFGSVAIAILVAAEAVLLCLAGATIGAAAAWVLYDGKQDLWGNNVFRMTVSPGLIGLGVFWALAIALLGAVFPAIRAARLPVVEALRAA